MNAEGHGEKSGDCHAPLILFALLEIRIRLKRSRTEIFAGEAAYDLVKEKGMAFREAYRYIGDHPEEVENLSAKEILKKYTLLGSPGNVGLERLRERLEKLYPSNLAEREQSEFLPELWL